MSWHPDHLCEQVHTPVLRLTGAFSPVMHLPSLFVVVVYASAYLLLLFGAICLACGLYYLVELAEEYTRFTKRLIHNAILGELVLHFFLWAYERMWFVPNLIGVISHVSYLLLLRSFPYIKPSSPPFLISCVLFITSNLVWYRYFHSDPEFFYHYRVGPMASTASFFFLCIWLVPLGFFVSLTVNDSVLPSSASMHPSHAYATAPKNGDADRKKGSQNIVLVTLRNAWSSFKAAVGLQGAQGDILSSGHGSRLR